MLVKNLILPVLVSCIGNICVADTNFTAKIFQKFGAVNKTNNKIYLNIESFGKLTSSVLDGQHYKEDANVCESSNCGEKCFSISPPNIHVVYTDQFRDVCPRILYGLTQNCVVSEEAGDDKENNGRRHDKPPPASVWGFGFLFVTLINLCSLIGITVLPLMNKSFYSFLLMFLIALAVGCLCANGILVLIPEAFEIMETEGYIWKACCVFAGVYMFFLTERILKILTKSYSKINRPYFVIFFLPCLTSICFPIEPIGASFMCASFFFTNKKLKRSNSNPVGCVPIDTYVDVDRTTQGLSSLAIKANDSAMSRANLVPSDQDVDDVAENGNSEKMEVVSNGHVDVDLKSKDFGKTDAKPVDTVAWMIIFGDAFHNFIDGLSIGAAFADSTVLGFSICIAVLCEELPHELGDFAILLNAGMSKKKALLFNFLSACTCYLGLIIGISLSEVSDATPWILGLAGGMFLYISLADMMPEMNHAAEYHEDKPVKVFLIQNLGLILGFVIIFLVTKFGDHINFSA